MIADEYEIPRSELEELAVRSHQLAAKATEEGLFEREMVPIKVNGDTYVTDQGIRPDTNLEALANLKPAFKPDGKITAATSSQISDGAAAVLLMSAEKARELGLTPRARIIDQTSVGCDPVKMLEGPIPATARLLARNAHDDRRHRLRRDQRGVRAGRRRVGAASTSPTWTASTRAAARWRSATRSARPGARLLTTLLHELEDDDKEIGLVTMCCGGGLGTGTLIQRI